MPAAFAFLHHLAAFFLVGALAVQFVLVRDPVTLASARRLRLIDAIYGVSALVLFGAGVSRVHFFEKGEAFYDHNIFFLTKLGLFFLVALMSVYPTVEFFSWRKAIREGRAPAVSEQKMRRIRKVIHWQLAAVVVILLCAALMAKGIGHFG